MYIDKAKEKAKNLYPLTGWKPTPCTHKEVEELERWCGHRFPEAYREFLLWMGRSGGGFLAGSDCFYRHLKELPAAALELLAEDQFTGQLPANIFIFFMHQGYQFNFFYFDDGDDPPVYWYIEEMPTKANFTELYAHFSDFILTEIEGHIKAAESRYLRKWSG